MKCDLRTFVYSNKKLKKKNKIVGTNKIYYFKKPGSETFCELFFSYSRVLVIFLF